MVRGSKDLPEKTGSRVGVVQGGKKQCNCHRLLKNKEEKGQKPKPKREWHLYRPHCGPWVLNSPLCLSMQPTPGPAPTPSYSAGSLPLWSFSWDVCLFHLKQKVQSACLLNVRAWDRKGLPRQDRVGSPSPPFLGTRPQDGMHCTRSGPSSSSEVSEELGDSSESASVAPTPGSRQRRWWRLCLR